MNNQTKKIFIFSFGLTVIVGLSLLVSVWLPVRAADVNINATVSGGASVCGNSVVEGAESCDDGNIVTETCGDSVVQTGTHCDATCDNLIANNEQCESNSDCGDDQECNSNCRCEESGYVCIPHAAVCSYGPCINGFKNGTCSDGCSLPWPAVPLPCTVAGCGNTVVETGEECDDGNTASGDGCSATCQLEVGCGNATIETGEQCDDGNVNAGDCCSGSCQAEILISNVVVTPTNTTSAISWTTPCQATNSLLEWGQTVVVSDGSASLSGSSYSYTINNLTPSQVYFFRITATSASLQAVYTGSFLTTGGIENCTNDLDDDNDGFCDYPASSCSDGSVAGDPECACEANFVCTPQACDPQTNQQTVNCVDQTVPKCQADYSYDQTCDVCPGVTCGPCQELDTNSCTCVVRPNCCGNQSCEPPTEDPYNCAIDCPVDCLSDWECTPWSPEICPVTGIQTRDCFDRNACAVPINRPPITQTCGGVCVGLACGTCQQINLTQCVCEDQVVCCGNGICESGESYESCQQDCILPCQPNWTCIGWGECVDNIQRRECYDLNNCNLNLDRPPEIKACGGDCEVACSTCQQIDLASCSCFATSPCCGNGSCEVNETVWACPVDCGLPPEFHFGLTKCLDGIDNDRDGLVDYPADPGCTKPSDNSELNLTEIVENVQKFLQEQIFDNPQVETANQAAAPLLVTVIAINTFATFSFFNFFSYLQFFVTQPFAVLFRRKRRKWGVVYNSLTKQPIDLAIVRLYHRDNGQLVRSRVTDKQGRYNFLIDPGKYYITVTKPKFDFPSQYLKDTKEDIKYLDLYHGEDIEVTDSRADITVNIPIDPQIEEKPVAKIIFQHYLRQVQYFAAFSAVPLAAVSMVVSPGALTFTIFGFHCLLYVLFRRLGYQKPPKNWGIVYDKDNKKPLGRAIARIYDKQFNKLLETRVTDGKGRYSFLVNNNVYYVTAERLGYKKAKTADIDLVSKDKEAVVGMDIALEKGVGEAVTPPSVSAPSVPPTPPVTPVAKIEATPKPRPTLPQAPQPVRSVKVGEQDIAGRLSELAVSRESLEELVKAKQAAQELKQEIDQRVEQLEEFEEKFEEIKEGIDKKLEKLGPDTKAETGQEPGETQPSQPPKPAVKEPTPPTKPTPPKTSSELLDDKEENPADKKEPPTGKSIFG